ncbi:MAG: lipid-A-disaccharide synthase [Bacteroidales bacterium]
MKYYIIAGEASGDLHASNLIKALKQIDPNAQFRCWGGDLMKQEGAELVKHYKNLAFMGFIEVVLHLRTIWHNLRFCKKDILSYQPNVLILVDYPGFNLKIAKFAYKKGFKVVYYISPQVWAWHGSRVKQMKKYIHRLFVILPFEKDFFKSKGMEVDFVGHPLLDALDSYHSTRLPITTEKEIIALLPGSRKQEISTILPLMLSVIDKFPEYTFVIAGSEHIGREFYKPFMSNKNVEIVFNQTYDLLAKAKAALVKSGTATLETALWNVPEVVCYKGNAISYSIAVRLIKNIKYISLVNLILNKTAVVELIQKELNAKKIEEELLKIVKNKQIINSQQKDFQELREKLGQKGASLRLAHAIFSEFTR